MLTPLNGWLSAAQVAQLRQSLVSLGVAATNAASSMAAAAVITPPPTPPPGLTGVLARVITALRAAVRAAVHGRT